MVRERLVAASDELETVASGADADLSGTLTEQVCELRRLADTQYGPTRGRLESQVAILSELLALVEAEEADGIERALDQLRACLETVGSAQWGASDGWHA